MISRHRIEELILQALSAVNQTEPVYKNVTLNGATIVLGRDSPLDSVTVSAFATALEEQLEDETGEEYILNIDDVYNPEEDPKGLPVGELARRVFEDLQHGTQKT